MPALRPPSQAEDKDGIMSTMTHIRDVRKKAPMVTGLFGPLKDTVLLLKSRGIPMDLPPVNKQVRVRRPPGRMGRWP